MKDQEIRRQQMLVRVRDFGEGHAELFPNGSLGGEKFAVVSTVVRELEEHAAAQSSSAGGAKGGVSSKASVRDALRRQMDAISRTARTMAAATPGVESSFRLPYSKGDQALINAARAFVQDATPLKNEFVRREMPADFLDQLNAGITAFEQASNSKNLNTEKRVAATAAIDNAIEHGMMAVRELDAIIRNKLHNDPATLAAWESASHVERTSRRKSVAGPDKNEKKPDAPAPN